MSGQGRVLIIAACIAAAGVCKAQPVVELPAGVSAVWDMDRAQREATPTRERICINGLWRWQPVGERTEAVPPGGWGYLKVPAPWPGTQYWMHRESQTHYPHPSWQDRDLSLADMAWYQREVRIPQGWAGRRIRISLEYLNSYAAVFLDGESAGEVYFPGGEVELTDLARPGEAQVLSLFTAALPLNEEIMSYADATGGRRSQATVIRRGLCGDAFLVGEPAGARIADVRVDTSVREWRITLDVALDGLADDGEYRLRAAVGDDGDTVRELVSDAFGVDDVREGRIVFSGDWWPEKLWDLHTPENVYELRLALEDADGDVVDAAQSTSFGFRELWVDGRDFVLNGTRVHCCAVPLDNAQIGATAACYEGARESLRRLKTLGVNLVYTHNYDCLPGSHLSFDEILRAADDVGMLVSLSMPHVKDYEWDAPDADTTNGYADHAGFYVLQAQNHPAVVMYSMNHNFTGYAQDMNPDRIDGLYNPHPDPSGESDLRTDRAARLSRRGEAIVRGIDPSRVIYHHSSGNNGHLHTINCYLNFVPIQERSDWFEHWATEGVKPVFLCEYGVPIRQSWTMHRGWYEGRRYWTNGKIKYQFCTAEWGSQFLGDASYQLTEPERADLRWEAEQWRAGSTWYRWDYPFQVNGTPALGVPNIDDVQAMYITHNWRAFRTWGVSAINLWGFGNKWKLRDDVDTSRREFEVDWDALQRPGFSSDFIDERYERIDTAYEVDDWIPTRAARAFIRHNRPLLAYIGGGPEDFTTGDHIFHPGETVRKQLIVINDSREPVSCECSWRLALPEPMRGTQSVTVQTGRHEAVPLELELPADLPPGEYALTMTAQFARGETQEDAFTVHVLPRAERPDVQASVALFDPEGQTAALLEGMGVAYDAVEADAELAGYDMLVIGRRALSPDGPAPDLSGVPAGMRVVVFEQTAEVLEQRLGFRVQDHGLRRAFARIPDHPLLAGLADDHLRDWRGEATLLPPCRDPGSDPGSYPSTRWCGIEVSRAWRCGCQGNVSSVQIEKPAAGDFLPIIDAGFSLQYAPLLLHREGDGMILFCQIDVTGRTEADPAAARLGANMLQYAAQYSPPMARSAVYVGEAAGREHLGRSGVNAAEYAGGAPPAGAVLIVGPGGGAELAPHADAIAGWLDGGGRVLALGLDGEELDDFLPVEVTTHRGEHIDAYFERPEADSPLAGVGPPDVLVREPRELPLVTGGAEALGDGVLATAREGQVVMCQLVPWQFEYEDAFHVKMTFRRASFLLNRLLANLGVRAATPLREQMATPLPGDDAARSILGNGDFSADEDGDGVADHWTVSGATSDAGPSRERIAGGEDAWCQRLSLPALSEDGDSTVMLSQHDVPVEEGQWYRISLRARAEGLRGARVSLTIQDTETWRSLLDYRYLAPDEQWREFSFFVQPERTLETGTRLQLWYGSVGTVWIADVRMVPCAPPTEGRWLAGLYLDEPVKMDDPYRFFRW